MQGSTLSAGIFPLLRSAKHAHAGLCATRRLAPQRQLRCAVQQQAQETPSTSGRDLLEKKSKLMPPRPRFTAIDFKVDKDSAFIDLELRKIQDEVGRVRVRQHVNVLASRYQQPVPPPNWAELFDDPTKPLFLDIGCGYGRFLLQLSRSRNDFNFVGMEVREKVAVRANEWAKRLGARHVYFAGLNSNVNFATWVASYPGPLGFVSVQFPDPNFKRKHRKRRIVQPQLAREIAAALAPGGTLFFQSDIIDLSKDMRDTFERCCGDVLEPAPDHSDPDKAGAHFAPRPAGAGEGQPDGAAAAAAAAEGAAALGAPPSEDELPGAEAGDLAGGGGGSDGEEAEGGGGDDAEGKAEEEFVSRWAAELPGGGWLRANPVGVPTEREVATLAHGGGVYRMLLLKKTQSGGGAAPAAAE